MSNELDIQKTSREECQPKIDLDGRFANRILQDWLLQERIISQRLREKSDAQVREMQDSKVQLAQATWRIERLQRELEETASRLGTAETLLRDATEELRRRPLRRKEIERELLSEVCKTLNYARSL
jgi:hypothetical protein